MAKEVTIYDIAKGLGISPTTVSRAMNNHPAVNEKTKEKIRASAEAQGYRANMFASNLRKQRTDTIGVIVPMLNNYFQSSVISGIETVANEEGFNLIISQSLENFQKEIANARTMFNSRVDGLLVSLAYDTENIEHFQPFFKSGIPVVFYDRVAEHNQCIGITIDNVQAAYKATSHLIENGCRDIVHISGSLKLNVYSDRLKGYKYALMDHNLLFRESHVITKTPSEESGIEAAQLLLKMKKLPDGVFGANDICTVSCMQELKKAGVSIPEDIAFVGFDNDPISRIIEPNLTTIHYPGYEMGKLAVKTLLNQISKDEVSDATITGTITLRSDLIVRESSVRRKRTDNGNSDKEYLPTVDAFKGV